jgi:hypothetical protein
MTDVAEFTWITAITRRYVSRFFRFSFCLNPRQNVNGTFAMNSTVLIDVTLHRQDTYVGQNLAKVRDDSAIDNETQWLTGILCGRTRSRGHRHQHIGRRGTLEGQSCRAHSHKDGRSAIDLKGPRYIYSHDELQITRL